jgi:acyl carrier protein
MTEADTLQVISNMIREVVGEDWDFDEPITMDSTFNGDLELESIEFVALAERMTAHYGENVDFAAWFSELDFEEIVDLTVGDVVRYVDECRTSE